ncbi:MAG: CDGSH-type Zn-finger protein [Saprospiraceae bacterium]|jgi:CDGSH-type Zn-finger protein
MEKPKIAQKGPYVESVKAGTYYFCACGQSSNQPYCDGSHAGTSFTPKAVEITEDKTVAWCGCKQSDNGAFCNGTHAKL